jgi:hypothetical protein
VSWRVIPPTDERRVVTAVFDGFLTAEEGIESAKEFRAAFGSASLAVEWDVTNMSGFDTKARNAWAEAIWPIRGQIERLRVVGARGMVRIGATFLAMLLGKPYEFVAAAGPDRRAS